MCAALLRRPKLWLAILPLVLLLIGSVAGNGGWLELRRLKHERAALAADLFDLMRQNERLRSRIRALRESDRALERLARVELGLVREGEIVYRFRSQAPPDGG